MRQNFIKAITNLYGDCDVYGPYKPGKDKRRRACIRVNGKLITKQYAKFKLEIKLGKILGKNDTVDHIDGDVTNDRFSNLRLLSRKDNIVSYRKSSRYKKPVITEATRLARSNNVRGERNPNAKLTVKKVLKLRKLDLDAKGIAYYAEKYGVSVKTIRNAINGVSYSHV